MFKCYCSYCASQGYLWRIDNTLWVEIPKNASSAIKSDNQMHQLGKKDISKYSHGFFVLRDPIVRFKSLVSHYFVHGYRSALGKRWLNELGIHDVHEDNIVSLTLENFDKLESIQEPHHWNSQSSFIPNAVLDIPNLKVYDINEPNPFVHRHSNKSRSSEVVLTEEQTQRVKELYKDDVELYNHQILFRD